MRTPDPKVVRDLKRRVKPHVLDLLDFLGVPHGFTRTPEILDALKRLARPAAPEKTGPRILVVSFRGAWLLHGAWEALIAEALRRRGARPTVFLCSGGLPEALPGKAPACGIAGEQITGPSSCAECLECGQSLARALDLPTLRLDALVSPKRVRELMALVDQTPASGLRGLTHLGVPVGEYVRNSARWFLCVSDLDAAAQGEAVVRAFAKSALVLAEAAPALLDHTSPETVFMLNGLFFAERIIKAEAERRRIRVVSYERGFIPDTLCFSETIPAYYDIDRLWETVKDVPLSPAQDAELDDYLADRRKGLRAPFNYWPTLTEDDLEVLNALDLHAERPTALLFSNITWDSAAQDRDRAFSDMFEWIAETVRLFATLPEAQLVVRVHPAEVRVPGWLTRDPLVPRLRAAFPEMPPNVRIVPPESDLSSYTLMRLSRCGLVYSSTAGLEMAMDGIPTVVAGLVHYAGKGFTRDPRSPSDYASAVREALGLPRDGTRREQARRYGHALFFRSFLPFPLVSENAPDFIPTLNATDPAVLDPGGDPTLDVVCRGILGGGDFFAET
jgi:hypothetical protein